MPESISFFLVGVWIAVGFCAGFGWAIGHALAARLTR